MLIYKIQLTLYNEYMKLRGDYKMTFKIGQLVITRGVSSHVIEDNSFYEFILESLRRYLAGDWGDIPNEDKKMNDSAVKNNDDRIVARYNDIYIITEYDRSYTTILFTHEY